MLGSIAFQFITPYTIFFEVFAMILTAIVLLVAVFYLTETPKYLINKKRTEEARKTLNRIARINHGRPFHDFNDVQFYTETVSKSDVKHAKEE